MPNIEIHGMASQPSRKVILTIFRLFSEKPYFEELVVTVVYDEVVDGNGNLRPFLRLITTTMGEETVEIIKLLKTLGMDIEHIVAMHFYQKED